MNNKIFPTLALGAALTILGACDNWTPPVGTDGTLNMESLTVDVSEIEKVISIDAGTSSRAETAVDVNSFIVRITDATGAKIEEWTYSTTPEVATLAPGAYKLEILSHEVQPAEWERPYFYASKDFTIVSGAIERIGTLTAKLANAAVSVRFDEELRMLAGNDVQVEVVANDEGKLAYGLDETRKGYFKVLEGSSSIVVSFNGTVNGYKESVVLPAKDLEAGQHRIYTFKAKVNDNPVPDETGNIDPSTGISIDVSVTDEDVDGNITLEEDVEPVNPNDRPGYEEPVEPQPGPGDDTEPAATFVPSDDLDLNGVNKPSEYGDGSELAPGTKQALVTINCPGKFAHIEVDIVSPYLTEEFLKGVGLSTHFDLAYPGEFKSALVGFNFPVEGDVIGKTTVDFNITSLVPLLGLSGDDTMEHKFVITVTDQAGKTAKQELVFREQ